MIPAVVRGHAADYHGSAELNRYHRRCDVLPWDLARHSRKEAVAGRVDSPHHAVQEVAEPVFLSGHTRWS